MLTQNNKTNNFISKAIKIHKDNRYKLIILMLKQKLI